MNTRKIINQGDIYFADLPTNRGSEEAGHHPVVVVSSSRMNSWCTTVIVVPLTSNMKHRSLVTHVPFQYIFGKGAKQSLAMCEHVRELDKKYLSERKVGEVSRRTLSTILDIVKEFVLREDYA